MTSPLRNTQRTPEVEAKFAQIRADREARTAARPQINKDGEAALRRLFDIAHGHSGQCRYVAAFLLGLYNGGRFRFDLTDLRGLDAEIFDDCIKVLKMDSTPKLEVHQYFENGGERFEQLAKRWAITDYLEQPIAG